MLFFFTDIHGRINLFHTILNWCYEQDPNCIIFYGGDAADRGPKGYQIIKELLDDSHIVYLYGNHEDLFVKAADSIISYYAKNDQQYEYLHNCNEQQATKILQEMTAHYNDDVKLHILNGGEITLKDWLCDGANEEIIDRLRTLPKTFSYKNIDFCHAGSTYNSFKIVNEAEKNKTTPPFIDEQAVIWDRNCLALGWETNRICVHGHTPTIHLSERVYGEKNIKNIRPCSWHDLMGGRKKRGGLKIDMDTGTFITHKSYVLNCETFYSTGFFDNNGKIEQLGSLKLD